MTRPLRSLPKAHLHLHLTGAMRHSTLVELARDATGPAARGAGRRLAGTAAMASGERGWFRFQRLYDIARSVLRRQADVPQAAARDRGGRGGRRLGLAGNPGRPVRLRGPVRRTHPHRGTRARRGGAGRAATGVGIGVVIAANRTKHPLEARTLARLAAPVRRARGDRVRAEQRRAARRPAEFASRPSASQPAGLLSVPHGGELCGPASVRACLDDLRADRIGHGIAAARDPAWPAGLRGPGHAGGVPLLQRGPGHLHQAADVPLHGTAGRGRAGRARRRRPTAVRLQAHRPVRAGQDAFGVGDAELAELARMSVRGSWPLTRYAPDCWTG